MKIFRIILVAILILAVLAMAGYAYFLDPNPEPRDLVKIGLVLVGLVLSLIKIGTPRTVSNKKTLFEKSYPEFIQNVFSEDKKLERKFFDAVYDYNRGKPALALNKLGKLRRQCQRTADLYAVTVFTALSLDDMRLYTNAAAMYQNALQMRPNTTLASNMGLCFERSGNPEKAMEAYSKAIDLNPNNEFALNNMGSLFFKEGDYESALDYAEAAIDANPRMPQALSLASMCCALLKDTAGYENYYRKAVSAGYDGRKIKQMLHSMDPTL